MQTRTKTQLKGIKLWNSTLSRLTQTPNLKLIAQNLTRCLRGAWHASKQKVNPITRKIKVIFSTGYSAVVRNKWIRKIIAALPLSWRQRLTSAAVRLRAIIRLLTLIRPVRKLLLEEKHAATQANLEKLAQETLHKAYLQYRNNNLKRSTRRISGENY